MTCVKFSTVTLMLIMESPKSSGVCWHCTSIANAGVQKWQRDEKGRLLKVKKVRGVKVLNKDYIRAAVREFIIEKEDESVDGKKHRVEGRCLTCNEKKISRFVKCVKGPVKSVEAVANPVPESRL